MNLEKIKSSILGFIIGDALGVPFEFQSREQLKKHPVTTMVGGGSWNQPIGTWSDDTSMVLATMDSLLMGYNLSQLGKNFHHWLYQQKYTPDSNSRSDSGLSTEISIFFNPAYFNRLYTVASVIGCQYSND